ncbi:retrovirus-related pol polyprotein from transposon TNT 1-94, partial [Tanacetum coccineum]
VATTQHYPEYHNKAPKPHKSIAYSSKQSTTSKSHASTKHKDKEIAKQITPPSESASDEDSDPEQAQRDKQLQKNLALVAKYIKNIYSKPTNNNFKTSSNTRNKNIDTTSRSGNDRNARQFVNQRTLTVAGAREIVGNQVVQQTWIQCFNCKEFRHMVKECRKPKRAKDYAYHKENMLLCKQAEKELEAHYLFMARIQEVSIVESGSTFDTEPLEKVDSNTTPDSSDVCINDFEDDQNDDDQEYERSNDIHDRCRSALHNQDIELEKYKKYKDCQIEKEELEQVDELQLDKNEFSNEYDLLLQKCLTNNFMYAALSSMNDIDEYSEMECIYLEKIKECECLEIKLSKQTKN